MQTDIRIDPEFETLIPPMTPQERAGLEENLLADGCREPLAIWYERPGCPCGNRPEHVSHGLFRCGVCGRDFAVAPILLDGHNRLRICTQHGIRYETVDPQGIADRDSAKAWIIRNQVGRRNLNESQRAMLGAELEKIFARQVKPRQGRKAERQADGVPGGRPPAFCARDLAGAEMNVSPRLVQLAKKVMRTGSPALREAVHEGSISVSAAANIAHLPQEQQDGVVAAGPKAAVAVAKKIRHKRISTNAMAARATPIRPVSSRTEPRPATVVELPHDAALAAEMLLNTFGRDFTARLISNLKALSKKNAETNGGPQ